MRAPTVLGPLVLLAVATALPGCLTPRHSERAYLYQRPVRGTGDRSVTVSEADWTACDREADRVATIEYDNARIQQAIVADVGGGLHGALLLVAAILTTRGKPEPEALRSQREQTYEAEMRLCLERRGYPINAPARPDPNPTRDHAAGNANRRPASAHAHH